jgi:hypothetical protein
VPYLLFQAALDFWSSLMRLCFSDDLIAHVENVEVGGTKNSKGFPCFEHDWKEKNFAAVFPLVDAMLRSLMLHKSWQIRLKLTATLKDFVENCSQ